VETSSALYSFEHVPNIDTHIGCVGTFYAKNSFPAASTPAINSIANSASPFVVTLAVNPGTSACGFLIVYPDGTVSWNITPSGGWTNFCPAAPSQPSIVQSIVVTQQGLAVVASSGQDTLLIGFNWSGVATNVYTLENGLPGHPTAGATGNGNVLVSLNTGSVLFWPLPLNSDLQTTPLPAGVTVTAVAEDELLEQFFLQYSYPGPYYSLDCASGTDFAPPAQPNILPLAGNSSVLAARAAYDGYSHNWWQFTDEGTLSQYNFVGCPATLSHYYTVPAGTPLPWSGQSNVNVFALPA